MAGLTTYETYLEEANLGPNSEVRCCRGVGFVAMPSLLPLWPSWTVLVRYLVANSLFLLSASYAALVLL